ncbi:ribosome-binding factor A [gamma proteobacterium HTCC5015]|nr:ribosome-binding factor A [gamma proteobacterium HTCC5015]
MALPRCFDRTVHTMAKDYPRSYRVADQIQKDLANLIRTEVKDPRLSDFVTLEEVRVTRDLSQAKIYITTLDDKAEDSAAVLNRASGFLRGVLGKRLRLRVIPQLHFIYDATQEEAQRIDGLIREAIASDEQHHADDSDSGDQ